ncbi:MAG: MFS transporter, partial [Proteobacteria bacterium]|nr:MFS transporter [Burkholderiales bacterium]
MTIAQVMVIVMLTHLGVIGAKLLLALFALELGATPLQVGLTFALFSILPAIFAITAGRLIDRIGVRVPLLVGCGGVALSIAIVFVTPSLWALYPTAAAIGLFFMIYAVAGQSLVGSLGDVGGRTRNFSQYALAVALAGVVGRASTGVAIDMLGHRTAALLLAIAPAAALILAWMLRARMPDAQPTPHTAVRRPASDLLRIPALRRALIAAAVVESGNELFALFIPLYGVSIGLSASFIGLILATYAGATFVVRIVLPRLVALSSEETVLCGALLGASVVAILLTLTAQPALLLLLAAAYGLTLGCGMPLSMALTYARAPEGRSAEAIGVRQTVNKSIEVTVPVGFGALAGVAGLAPLAVAMAMC